MSDGRGINDLRQLAFQHFNPGQEVGQPFYHTQEVVQPVYHTQEIAQPFYHTQEVGHLFYHTQDPTPSTQCVITMEVPLVTWWYIIPEPRDPQTITLCYFYHKLCFSCWERTVYYLLVMVSGCFLAILWGCLISILVTLNVWCIGPCLRLCDCYCHLLREYWMLWLRCWVRPWVAACGACCSRLRLRHQPRPSIPSSLHVFTT